MRTGSVHGRAADARCRSWRDLHGAEHAEAPAAKIAAIEGDLGDRAQAHRWCCSALPDQEAHATTTRFPCRSWPAVILTHDWDGELKGLNEFEGKHPPVAPVFWAFRIMVGIGLLMLALAGRARQGCCRAKR
jgi:cytochrome bd ubiquinol oxidase subunit I